MWASINKWDNPRPRQKKQKCVLGFFLKTGPNLKRMCSNKNHSLSLSLSYSARAWWEWMSNSPVLGRGLPLDLYPQSDHLRGEMQRARDKPGAYLQSCVSNTGWISTWLIFSGRLGRNAVQSLMHIRHVPLKSAGLAPGALGPGSKFKSVSKFPSRPKGTDPHGYFCEGIPKMVPKRDKPSCDRNGGNTS